MENVRIMVRDALDLQMLTILDNSAVSGLHYTNDTLTRFVEGDASVFSCDVAKTHNDVQHLKVGNKLAFVWKGKDYWLNIISTEENEYSMTIMAFSLSLELNNETRSEYSSTGSMTFAQYLSKFDPEKTLTLGLNEVSDKKISYEWTGSQTMLARLYSLANVFSAEIEFVTVLNDDYSLKQITVNVYREHSDTAQGIGEDKTNITLRFGKEIKAITRKENIKEIYTAITPVGKDGLNLAGFSRTEYDENGRVEFFTDNTIIRAPLARDRFPSFSSSSTDRYISTRWETEYTTKEALYGAALAELKKNCVPQLEFEVDTYFDTNPGDTLTVESDKFKPTLIMEARVIEQVESFTDPSKNKTTFSNFKEIGSQIDSSLLARVQQLVEANRNYEYQMLSDNGTVFKNSQGSTTLIARVLDRTEDVTDSLNVIWYKDGVLLAIDRSIVVNASDIDERAVYRYTATNNDETRSGGFEVTVTNVDDGEPGERGESGIIYQEDEPTDKEDNMLWQPPEEPLQRWTGTQWVVHKFTADNILVENLTVVDGKFVKLEGASIVNPFDVISQGARIVGNTTMSGAKVRMEYTVPDALQSGFMEMNPQSVISTIYDSTGNIVSMFSLDSTGILLRQGDKSASLSVNDLSLYTTTLTIGYAISATLTRIGKMVTLSITRTSKNWTDVGENVLLSAVIPTGYRPRVPETVAINRNNSSNISTPVIVHINADGTMRYTNSSAGQFIFSASASWFTNDTYPT